MSYFKHIQQDVVADPNNSSTTNLEQAVNSRTFTGTKTSTLGIALIQVSLFATQNCIVKVEQSPDTTPHWDISDTFYYTANSTTGSWDVRAENSYVRVVVTSLVDTTTFRLQTALCPIGDPQPRALDPQGNFKVSLQGDNFGNGPAQFTPNQELVTSIRTRLVGKQFDGEVIDPNYWITQASTGTITETGGNIAITSGTASPHYARIYSKRTARYAAGAANKFRCFVRLADTGTANVKRRWGIAAIANYQFTVSVGTPAVGNVYTNSGFEFIIMNINGATIHCYGNGAPGATGTLTYVSGPGSGNLTYTATAAESLPIDGAYFNLDGTAFSVVTLKGTTETPVASGAFNGQYGYSYAMTTNNTIYEILYSNNGVTFIIGGIPLHKVTAAAATWTNTMHFNIFLDVINSGASSAVAMYSRTTNITRLGPLATQATSYNFPVGTTAGIILKYGPGNLHAINIGGIADTAVVTLYDGLTGSGSVIWTSGTMTWKSGNNFTPFSVPQYGIPFYRGLCLVVSTANAGVQVVYE